MTADCELLQAAAKAAGFAKFGPCLGGRGFRVEVYGDDPMAATRRAIVRAAALSKGATP